MNKKEVSFFLHLAWKRNLVSFFSVSLQIVRTLVSSNARMDVYHLVMFVMVRITVAIGRTKWTVVSNI